MSQELDVISLCHQYTACLHIWTVWPDSILLACKCILDIPKVDNKQFKNYNFRSWKSLYKILNWIKVKKEINFPQWASRISAIFRLCSHFDKWIIKQLIVWSCVNEYYFLLKYTKWMKGPSFLIVNDQMYF